MGQLHKEISQPFHLNAISNILKNSSVMLTDVSQKLEIPQFDSPLDGVSLLDKHKDNVSKPKAQPTLPLATKSSTVIPTHFHHVQITHSLFSSVDTVQNTTFYSIYQNIKSNPLPWVMKPAILMSLQGVHQCTGRKALKHSMNMETKDKSGATLRSTIKFCCRGTRLCTQRKNCSPVNAFAMQIDQRTNVQQSTERVL